MAPRPGPEPTVRRLHARHFQPHQSGTIEIGDTQQPGRLTLIAPETRGAAGNIIAWYILSHWLVRGFGAEGGRPGSKGCGGGIGYWLARDSDQSRAPAH